MNPQDIPTPLGPAAAPLEAELPGFREWPHVNQVSVNEFLGWLTECAYSRSTIQQYRAAVHQAMAFLGKPYWQIAPEADVPRADEFLRTRPLTPSTQATYHKALLKLGEYLRLRLHLPEAERAPNWAYYLGPFPGWLAVAVREYITHCQRSWPPERRYDSATGRLSSLTQSLRWMSAHDRLHDLTDLTPAVWLDYADERLLAGISPRSLNTELGVVQRFVRFQQDLGRPVSWIVADDPKNHPPLAPSIPETNSPLPEVPYLAAGVALKMSYLAVQVVATRLRNYLPSTHKLCGVWIQAVLAGSLNCS